MLGNDAKILIRSAVATAVAGLALIVIGAVMDGGKGAFGAALGVMLVVVFFTVSMLGVSLAERLWGPSWMMAAALGIFLAKVLAVIVIVAEFRDSTVFNTRLFGITAIAGILAWSAGQVVTLARRRVPYVEPSPTSVSAHAGGLRSAGEQ